jgi:hypothetical protein
MDPKKIAGKVLSIEPTLSGEELDYTLKKASEEFRQLESKVLEILKGRPEYVPRESVETKLNLPYPSGVVWHYGPVDPRINKRLREIFPLLA